MIASKFGIGQQVRHSLLGYLGVVVDIDPVYSLHTYLAEAQLSSELQDEHPEQPSMDELAQTIRKQLQAPRLRN